jgi:plastocyanin
MRRSRGLGDVYKRQASTDFPPKATYAHVFTTPGVYTFYCSIHGVPGAGMFGTIRVS